MSYFEDRKVISIIASDTRYDTDIHPHIGKIIFKRDELGDFFLENRFPNLETLIFANPRLRTFSICHSSLKKISLELSFTDYECMDKINLDCPLLEFLDCQSRGIRRLELNCPRLIYFNCSYNKIVDLKLHCPHLENLYCCYNPISTIELECPKLEVLWCQHTKLKNLNGLEFLSNLRILECDIRLKKSGMILKSQLENVSIQYY
jgi:hypothetical protein